MSQALARRDARLEACQRRSHAEMNAVAESDVRVGLTTEIEAVRVRKVSGVAIRGANHRQHQAARADGSIANFDVAERDAKHRVHGRTIRSRDAAPAAARRACLAAALCKARNVALEPHPTAKGAQQLRQVLAGEHDAIADRLFLQRNRAREA